MPAISLATAQTHLDLWLEAEAKVATGQAYQIGNRSMKRADLKEIRETITYWNGLVMRLSSGTGGIRLRGAAPQG